MSAPAVEQRRPDRYYGVEVVKPVYVGPTRYMAGELIADLPVRKAISFGTRVRIPLEEQERVGDPAHAIRAQARAREEAAASTPAPADATGAPHLAWIHDLPEGMGGAERSNAELIRVGRDLGWRITHVHRGNTATCPVAADAYLIGNTKAFADPALEALDRAIVARGAPIIVRPHDYGFCERRNALPCGGSRQGCAPSCQTRQWSTRRHRYVRWLERAALVVWISEAQRAIHERALGRVWRSECFLPPPVDPDFMRPVPGVERDPRLAVCAAGSLGAHKGRSNVRRWAEEHPDWRVEVYVRGGAGEDARHGGEWPANVTVLEAIEHDRLREVYSRAAVVLFLPAAQEPAGRTPVEAALCGARVEVNEQWSADCFGLPLDDPEALRARIRAARFDFWRAVEGVAA